MFEPRTEPLLSQRRFVQRMLKFLAVGVAVDALVVLAGGIAFKLTEGLAWLDAIVDSAMVVTEMAPGTRSRPQPGSCSSLCTPSPGGPSTSWSWRLCWRRHCTAFSMRFI